jgi:hypothetical protein
MYQVYHFAYSGIAAQVKPEFTTYTATFSKWTSDPGIAEFNCSDNRTRLIPVCAIKDFHITNHGPWPELTQNQLAERKAFGILLGAPCCS